MARLLLPAAVLAALACGACGQGPEDSTPAATAPPDPAATASIDRDAPPAAAPDGALRYACGDGRIVTIAWSGDDARVELGDGRTVTLPKAQSASSGAGDVFVGETISLERGGEAVALFLDAGERIDCRPANGAE